jgi:hypothetical protein
MDAHTQRIFCYDNAAHHQGVATFPHHKHLLKGVTESAAPRLQEVLAEVERRVLGIPS